MKNQNEFILYGLTDYKSTINQIAHELNISQNYFNLKLILTEALTNAFKYGNKNDPQKAICIKYKCTGCTVQFDIKHCGKNPDKIHIPNNIADDEILNNDGRGLFIINSLADDVTLKNNSMSIKMTL